MGRPCPPRGRRRQRPGLDQRRRPPPHHPRPTLIPPRPRWHLGRLGRVCEAREFLSKGKVKPILSFQLFTFSFPCPMLRYDAVFRATNRPYFLILLLTLIAFA